MISSKWFMKVLRALWCVYEVGNYWEEERVRDDEEKFEFKDQTENNHFCIIIEKFFVLFSMKNTKSRNFDFSSLIRERKLKSATFPSVWCAKTSRRGKRRKVSVIAMQMNELRQLWDKKWSTKASGVVEAGGFVQNWVDAAWRLVSAGELWLIVTSNRLMQLFWSWFEEIWLDYSWWRGFEAAVDTCRNV